MIKLRNINRLMLKENELLVIRTMAVSPKQFEDLWESLQEQLKGMSCPFVLINGGVIESAAIVPPQPDAQQFDQDPTDDEPKK